MKNHLHFSTTKPQDPDVVQITLHPENENEKRLLDENKDTETIELYYHAAVSEKLPSHVLLKVIDQSQWPYSAQVSVKKIGGIG